MRDDPAEPCLDEFATSSDLQELACFADRAFVTGDYNRCVAIVENIYDLLDRQSRVAASDRRPDSNPSQTGVE